MDSATYLKSRVDDQIEWMEKKSKMNQNRYKTLKLLEISAAALIPLLAGLRIGIEYFGIITGLLGVFIVVLNGIQQLHKYQENWITYRSTIESLKQQKFLFEANAEPYNDSLAFQKFVITIESLLAKENEGWKANWTNKKETTKNPAPALSNAGDKS